MSKLWLIILGSVMVIGGCVVTFFMFKADSTTEDSNNTQTTTQSTTQSNDSADYVMANEDFIKHFFKLIEDGQASEAVMLMSAKNTTDDSTKQAWGVQFNNINSVKVLSVSPENHGNWTDTYRQYKVVLDIVMNPASTDAPIPYYGYEYGQNTRYIGLVYENNTWTINEIATSQ